jgi:hypothetical protein
MIYDAFAHLPIHGLEDFAFVRGVRLSRHPHSPTRHIRGRTYCSGSPLGQVSGNPDFSRNLDRGFSSTPLFASHISAEDRGRLSEAEAHDFAPAIRGNQVEFPTLSQTTTGGLK